MSEKNDDWLPISSAPEGLRVRVAHELDPYSWKAGGLFRTTGIRDGEKWTCDGAFVCIDGVMRRNPTHWLHARTSPQ